MISSARREDIVSALRRGTVPRSGLDAMAVGIDSFAPTLDDELESVSPGRGGFKAVRGKYGTGKTFFGRWLHPLALPRCAIEGSVSNWQRTFLDLGQGNPSD